MEGGCPSTKANLDVELDTMIASDRVPVAIAYEQVFLHAGKWQNSCHCDILVVIID
jgi:hypothetical protein